MTRTGYLRTLYLSVIDHLLRLPLIRSWTHYRGVSKMTCSTVSKASSPAIGSSVRSSVICDFLDVTCKPEDSFVDALDDWACAQGLEVVYSDIHGVTFRVDGGVLKIDKKFNWHRASASGAFIGFLRKFGLFRDYVNILGSVPHTVTRLDAALDVSIDAPLILSALGDLYGGSYSFGRKALRTKTIYETRVSDGAITGTWYAGHRSKARVTGRVYDKQQERLSCGIVIAPLTRYELTFKKDYGCSLWDALMPKSLFYSHSSGLVEPPPEGFDQWDSRGLVPWTSEPVDTELTVDKFSRSVEHSVELSYLAKKGSKFGATGKAVLMRRFEMALDSLISEAQAESDS